MKKIIVVLAVAFSLAAVAQGPAAAGDGARPARMRGGRMVGAPMMRADPLVRAVMMPKVAEKLNLTPEQRAKVDALKGGAEENAALRAKVNQGMQKQAELLKAEKIDEAAVMAALDMVWDARKEMAKAQTRRVIAVKSILTPEQIAQALEEVKNLRCNMEHRRGPRPAGGPRGPRGKGAKATVEAPAAPAAPAAPSAAN